MSLRFRFDGRELTAPRGSTIAGALLSNGQRAWRTTRTGDQRRGLFCGIGTCFDCLVDLNGDKAVRACLALLQEGDEVSSSDSVGPGELSASPTNGGPAPGGKPDGRWAKVGILRMPDVIVVGAGPAGMAAAAASSRRGARVVLVDGAPRLGGQYFRQPLAEPSEQR